MRVALRVSVSWYRSFLLHLPFPDVVEVFLSPERVVVDVFQLTPWHFLGGLDLKQKAVGNHPGSIQSGVVLLRVDV